MPAIGKHKLDRLTTETLDGMVTAWRAGAEPSTINVRLDTLRRMLVLAVDWRLIRVAPTVAKLPVAKGTPRFLSQEEAALLLEAALPQWRSMILVGLRTGLRIGELRGLLWGDVSFERRVITVRRTDPGRPDMAANAPKGKRERTVPLTPDTYRCLAELAFRAGMSTAMRLEGFNTGEEPAVEVTKASPDERLHVWPALPWRGKARPDGPRSAGRCFTAIADAAEAAGLKDVGPHTLRHTFASWLVMRGVPLTAIQELLGHANVKQTMIYAHLAPGFAHAAAVAALDFALVTKPTAALPSPSDSNATPSDSAPDSALELPKGRQKVGSTRKGARRSRKQSASLDPV